MQDTCKIVEASHDSKVLGFVLGANNGRVNHFQSALANAQAMHEAIDLVGDSAVEVVLKSECAGVAKVVHILRATGDRLSQEALASVDESLRVSLGQSLGGDIAGNAWSQAQCPFNQGGLGWTSAADLALPAFIASRVSSRPAVVEMFAKLEAAGLGLSAQLQEVYDKRLDAASARLAATLPVDLADAVGEIIERGREQTESRWRAECGEDGPVAPTVLDPTPAVEALAAGNARPRGAVASPERDEDEPGNGGTGHKAVRLQRDLMHLKGQARTRNLMASLRIGNRQADVARLTDLLSDQQDRSWLWSINKSVDACLEPRLYSVAVRLMLGAEMVSDDALCGGCGKRVLDPCAAHATCCHGAAVTIGHNRIRDLLAMGFAVADPATSIEPAGLVASKPDLRPADILTRSVRPSGFAAIDVGVASPHAAYAGDDCLDAMRQRKLAHYGEAVLDELAAEGIEYTPALISCYGRRSTTLSRLICTAALRAARVRGLACGTAIEARWKRSVAVEVWRRAACLVLRCFPWPERCGRILGPDESEFAVSGWLPRD